MLIGDSGERDPEVFEAIRQMHPAQVDRIFIRDIVNDEVNNPDRLADITAIPAKFDSAEACHRWVDDATAAYR